MLENLIIENYALIEKLELNFTPGMNVLTGETGAGKSILAGALGLLRGARATTGSIRNGTEKADVAATFVLPESGDAAAESRKWLEDRDIGQEDGRVVIRRILKTSGKGNSYIQGTMVPRQDIEAFTSIIMDMHGQHEHQSLFNIQQHRKLLDSFGNCGGLLDKVQRDFLFLNEKKEELKTLHTSESERQREMELLQFAVKEIEELAPQLDEDLELDNERLKLQQYEKLYAYTDDAYSALKEGQGGALDLLYTAMKSLKAAGAIDELQKEWAEKLESLYYEVEDVFSVLSGYRDDLTYDPQRLEFIEDRLAELSRLKNKYGGRLQNVIHYKSEAVEKLAHYEHSDEYAVELGAEIKRLETDLVARSLELSNLRKEAGRKLEATVVQSLGELGMGKSRFTVNLSQKLSERGVPVCGAFGIDRVEFLLSANQGEPLKPLRSIASGGELSRVMLAIKTALADSDDIPTLVFDEIDTGIGGEVGLALGRHLRSLSSRKQILSITHLASIAAHADNHIQVRKAEKDGRTITRAALVSGEQRVAEIARMLSGDSSTQASLVHARELLSVGDAKEVL